jgi:cytochrome c oxidase subunit IV
MMRDSAFAVTNFGIVYFIAQILKVFVQYFGAKPLMRSSQVMNIMMVKTSVHRIILVLLLTIFLILLSLVVPRVAMFLYILIPFISFLMPNNSRGFR